MSRDFLPTCRPSIRRWIKSWPALANAGLEGEVYLRGAAPAMHQSLQATGLIVHESPLDLVHVLPRVSVIIHHAGSGVAELAMSSGCPQLLLPRHLEQKLTGDASGSPAQWTKPGRHDSHQPDHPGGSRIRRPFVHRSRRPVRGFAAATRTRACAAADHCVVPRPRLIRTPKICRIEEGQTGQNVQVSFRGRLVDASGNASTI